VALKSAVIMESGHNGATVPTLVDTGKEKEERQTSVQMLKISSAERLVTEGAANGTHGDHSLNATKCAQAVESQEPETTLAVCDHKPSLRPVEWIKDSPNGLNGASVL